MDDDLAEAVVAALIGIMVGGALVLLAVVSAQCAEPQPIDTHRAQHELLLRLSADWPGSTPAWAVEYQRLCGGYLRWYPTVGHFKRLGSTRRARFALVDGRVTLLDDAPLDAGGSTRGALRAVVRRRAAERLAADGRAAMDGLRRLAADLYRAGCRCLGSGVYRLPADYTLTER